MARHLAMDKVRAIHELHALGWSQRRIAERLGVDRKAVRRHLKAGRPKGTEAPTGKAPTGAEPRKGTEAPTGSDDELQTPQPGVNEAVAAAEAGGSGPRSRSDCEPWREVILGLLDVGLSAQRIYQDLSVEHGFQGSYWSVRRFVQGLERRSELPFRRMEKAPGEEAQVDFGTGARWTDTDGRRRKSHVLRIVLSHSRKAYSEAVDRQTTENFIRVLENAFWYFGGVPKTLVIDNLKAAVTRADWFDPELNPKIIAFAKHYGTAILPTKPYTPRHKGKVERGVDYVQENALKGRSFGSLAEQNEHLLQWERTVADTRIHGTTKRHVGKHFEQVERAALGRLPTERFPFFHEGRRRVSRDGHVEVAKAYYSVPLEYLARDVWVRWDSRLVRVFNHRWEQVAVHPRSEPGRFSTSAAHIASEKTSGIERGAEYLLRKVHTIGPHSQRWAEAMLQSRGVEGLRVLQGLLSLASKHDSATIEEACRVACQHQVYRLRVVKQLCQRRAAAEQQTMDWIEEHPLIRPLSEYGQFVHDAIQGGI